MSITVVGLSVGHDCGCALVRDGDLIVAVSEERLNRHRYSGGWSSSLAYCLSYAGTRLDDIDLFVFSSGGPNLPSEYDGGLSAFSSRRPRAISVDHHLSHALGAYCLSGFSDAAVIVFDAVGNNEDTESSYEISRHEITRISDVDPDRPRWRGIGSTYEAFTNFLGFSDEESGKTMALAAYGDPQQFQVPLFDYDNGRIMGRLEQTHQWGVQDFGIRNNLQFGSLHPPHDTAVAKDIAAYVQRETEAAVIRIVGDVVSRTSAKNLCLSGGVALNCVANSRVRAEFPGISLFVLPAASDTGQPLGNALFGHWYLTGDLPAIPAGSFSFGRTYDGDSILRALRKTPDSLTYGRLYRFQFEYHQESDPVTAAAQLLADGAIIGWFEGRSELGPRALGHRSILADPRNPEARTVLNSKIKHREWFRPFAPSILADSVEKYTGDTVERPFMLESPLILPEATPDIAAAVHIDGSARIQTVDKEHAAFYNLIRSFEAITGVPALLNTSFNIREPIVETPGHALGTFLASDMDYLIIGDYLVSKKGRSARIRETEWRSTGG